MPNPCPIFSAHTSTVYTTNPGTYGMPCSHPSTIYTTYAWTFFIFTTGTFNPAYTCIFFMPTGTINPSRDTTKTQPSNRAA